MEKSKVKKEVASSRLLKHAESATGWNNHLPLVYLALEETHVGDVIEMGMGDGSTMQLSEYCKSKKRLLKSYDAKQEWIDRFLSYKGKFHEMILVDYNSWSTVYEVNKGATVILIDHQPERGRKFCAEQYKDSKCIVICHDAQPQPNAGDYQYETIYHNFKYKIRFQPPFNSETNDYPAGAIALSNYYNIEKWEGIKIGEWTVSNEY